MMLNDDQEFDDDRVLEEFERAWWEPPSPDFLAHGCVERMVLGDRFRPGPNGVMESVAEPLICCQHFPSKALNNGHPAGPLIAVDFVIVCVHGGVKGVSVLGIVTVGAVGHTGERGPRLLQGIDELLAAERAQIKRIMDRHGDIFAGAGILPPIATTAAEILELIEVAATGSAGGFDPRPARLH